MNREYESSGGRRGGGGGDYRNRNRGGGGGGRSGSNRGGGIRGSRGRGGGGRGGRGGHMSDKPPEDVFMTPAQVMDDLRRLGATFRGNRYGTAGEPLDLQVNCYPADLEQLKDFIYHYDITIEELEKDDSHGSSGSFRGRGSGGRGRGRGGRQTDRPVPVRIATRVIRQCEQEERSDFNNARIAYDGRKNAYTAVPPKFYDRKTKQNDKLCRVCVDDTDYNVTFRLVNEVPMRELAEYVSGGRQGLPQECVTALDVVLRTAPMRDLVYTGRGFSWQPPPDMIKKLRLGQGCEAWTTYYQAFRPQESGLMLTFDIMYTAMYTVQSVAELAMEILKGPTSHDAQDIGEEVLHKPLTKLEVKKLTNELRGIRILQSTLAETQVKEYPIDHVTESTADRIEFEEGTRSLQSVTVAQHFANVGAPLRYPQMPCLAVKVGKEKDGFTLIPLEKAQVAPGQRRLRPLTAEMKERLSKVGARNPEARLKQITQGLSEINAQTKEYLAAFGVKVNMDRLKIPGRVLPPPKILVGEGVELDLTDNPQYEYAWNLRSLKLHETDIAIEKWGVLVLAPVDKRAVGRFIECMRVTCVDMGLSMEEPRIKFGYKQTLQKDMSDLFSEVNGCQIMMVIKESITTIDYNEIKNVSDTFLGIPSQCVVQQNMIDPKPLYCRNLVLKMNGKVGGINMRIPSSHFTKLGGNFMIIGATVAHAPPISRLGTPDSVAAVVGSLDKRAGRQAVSYRFQEAKVPTIDQFGEMVCDVLKNFHNLWRFLPETLLIFRNGVSDGFFSKVLDIEFRDIRNKCKELGRQLGMNLDYSPKITFVVLQRGHHCRFIPQDPTKRDLSDNCIPGTVVDSQVAHPRLYDFFLVAHNGIQGVSRPTRYTVLMDDIEFDPDDLQELVYSLCYTFQRSNRSVSIVPAVYYADLVAGRMRRCLTARNAAKQLQRLDSRSVVRKDLPQEFTEGHPIVHRNLVRRFFYI